ncbi:unnamed protein product [Psylliodes chrysocephalus]|uniref:THAP-type domain-containing protein n=1 Tax=Psylliodes chrysocephalus TaxID=3402493 RepID=A0A9P0DCG8_9CUCU|nr:unnamed protein product [Psylliodes chrysocephala]
MVRKCMVLFCKNNKPPLYQLTSSRYVSWMRALGRNPDIENLTTHNVVCSAHFTDADFLFVNEKRNLKTGAVPSLYLGPLKPYNTSIGASSSQTKECSFSEKLSALLYKQKCENDNEEKENHQQSSYSSCRIPAMNIVADDVSATPEIYSTTFIKSESCNNNDVSATPEIYSTTFIKSESCNNDDEIFQEKDFPHEITQNVDISNDNRSSPTSMTTISPERQNVSLNRELDDSSSDSEGYEGTNKKIRKDVKIYHNYSASPRTIKKALGEVTRRKKTYQLALKQKKVQVKRLQQKVIHLKDVVWHLKKQLAQTMQ